jgi:6-phosphogluconolactonase
MSLLSRSSLLIAENAEELAHLGAALMMTYARDVLETQRHFDLVLSGGSTPKRLYQTLSAEHRDAIPWDRVRFFWSDERNVPPDHPESNFKMAKEALLDPLAIGEKQIFRFRTELGVATQIADHYEQTLRKLFKEPKFDFTLLGLGEDGHTASLFPDAWDEWAELDRHGRWIGAPWVPHLHSYRLTMLPNTIKSSRKINFLVSGSNKAKILREVLDYDPSQKPRYPAQLIYSDLKGRQRKRRALWLADRAAANTLRQAA